MPRGYKILLVALAVAVVIGLTSLRSLQRRVRQGQAQRSDAQARRAVLAPLSTPTDTRANATLFWAGGPDQVAPSQVLLPLSADPVQRSRQVLLALIAGPTAPDQRTLPADTEILGFYILPDGTAIADFSDALASETPSGILSEQVAVQSVAQTLAANVPTLRRLKILIRGQEAETLAGHVDLTGFFDLPAKPAIAAPMPSSATPQASH
jgi:spore germination protein GerM